MCRVRWSPRKENKHGQTRTRSNTQQRARRETKKEKKTFRFNRFGNWFAELSSLLAAICYGGRLIRANGQTFVYITAIKCLIINHINVQHVVYRKHIIFIRNKWKFIDSRFNEWRESNVSGRSNSSRPRRISFSPSISRSWSRLSLHSAQSRLSKIWMSKWIHNLWLDKQEEMGPSTWPTRVTRCKMPTVISNMNLIPTDGGGVDGYQIFTMASATNDLNRKEIFKLG